MKHRCFQNFLFVHQQFDDKWIYFYCTLRVRVLPGWETLIDVIIRLVRSYVRPLCFPLRNQNQYLFFYYLARLHVIQESSNTHARTHKIR